METQPNTSQRSLRQNSIYLLPNSFTVAALFSAFYAITQSMHGHYETAAIAVFISMLLDGMDGRVARLTNSQSAFGEQLDSLADMVSFGVAPALIAYKWQLWQFGKIGYSVAFIYCACAALPRAPRWSWCSTTATTAFRVHGGNMRKFPSNASSRGRVNPAISSTTNPCAAATLPICF